MLVLTVPGNHDQSSGGLSAGPLARQESRVSAAEMLEAATRQASALDTSSAQVEARPPKAATPIAQAVPSTECSTELVMDIGATSFFLSARHPGMLTSPQMTSPTKATRVNTKPGIEQGASTPCLNRRSVQL